MGTVVRPEIGLSGQSGNLKLHGFDSWEAMSWITYLFGFTPIAAFPGAILTTCNHIGKHWHGKHSAIRLAEVCTLVTAKARCGSRLSYHTYTGWFCSCWQEKKKKEKKITVLGIGRSTSSSYFANGFRVSHQQEQYFPFGLK